MMQSALFYIDPGTGSMLFGILVGIFATLMFFLQNLLIKIKFKITGGKGVSADSKNIPYVIFSDDKRYWNQFKSICDEFEKRKIHLTYYTSSEDDPALDEKYEYVNCEFIGEGNKGFAKLNVLKANVLLSTTPGLEVYQWKRSKGVKWYVHMYHCLGECTTYRMFGLDFYDAVLMTGAFQEKTIRKLEELRGIPNKELELVGLPYVDEMAKKIAKKEATTGDSVQKTTEKETNQNVLLAPTWGSSGLLTVYGEKLIDALVATGNDIVIRPHPQSMKSEKELMDKLMAKYPDSEKLKWNFDNDNFDALYNADIMISDFSGVIYDFAVAFNKPIIYFEAVIDLAPYDAAWLGLPEWDFEILPQIGKSISEADFDSLGNIIDEVIGSSEYEAGRAKARSEAWVNPMKSAEKIVDYMVRKNDELTLENSTKEVQTSKEAEIIREAETS